MSEILDAYLKTIEQSIATGRSTEHTHRPALESLLNALNPKITAVNEPKQRSDCGAPDYVILRKKGQLPSGHVEAKDIGVSLADTAKSEQLHRYLKFLPNLLLTDYVQFWHYIDGERVATATLGIVDERTGKITSSRDQQSAVTDLLDDFLGQNAEPIRKPKALAERLARLAHMIRDIVEQAFARKQSSNTLNDLRQALAQQLMPDLVEEENTAQFADLFAQTLAYGLFAAACNHYQQDPKVEFTLANAARDIPKTNPLLRQLFSAINGLDFEDEPYAGFVNQIVAVLSHSELHKVLEDFGKSASKQDPILHFYETFLATYDPTLREQRGVYYTPEPVVSFIVRSVDHILKTKFQIKDGLADTTKIKAGHPDAAIDQHRTLILDPAVGTGTFLYEVIRHIRDDFQAKNQRGLWNQYVHDHLLPRLFGFELLMAPYAVAHLKLGMQLAGQDKPHAEQDLWRYGFESDDRLQVYLTNTLEQAEKQSQQSFSTSLQRAIGDEAQQANQVKRDLPILVVLGNPPYSGISTNNDPWIDDLLKGRQPDGTIIGDESYYHVNNEKLGEKKVWLQDDYVKFIRWAQWRLEQTGKGVLAFITNHGYLDNPTFRGMRWSILKAFDEVYVLDLHGSAKRKEVCPDGSPDQNVFDIQQGVAICFLVKSKPRRHDNGGLAIVRHAEVWGKREEKYNFLSGASQSIATTSWNKIDAAKPAYLFKPLDQDALGDYNEWPTVASIIPTNVTGVVTARDGFVIDFSSDKLIGRISDLRGSVLSDDEVREKFFANKTSKKYPKGDTRGWKLPKARIDLRADEEWMSRIARILYRPFDTRSIYNVPWMVDWPRLDVMPQMLAGENWALVTARSNKFPEPNHFFVSRSLVEAKCGEASTQSATFPLYLYPGVGEANESPWFQHWPAGKEGRRPNLDPNFVRNIAEEAGLEFVPDGQGNLLDENDDSDRCGPVNGPTFGPEDVLAYIYAVFYWPEYRRRFAPMLKLGFPRVPTPAPASELVAQNENGELFESDPSLFFRDFVRLGRRLLKAHLLENDGLDGDSVGYPQSGKNEVAAGFPRYLAKGAASLKVGRVELESDARHGRIYISHDQYFEGVEPQVWEFQIGGYQVCEKWLKDRRGRELSYGELRHYRRVVESLRETIVLMREIESVASRSSN